MTTVSAEKLGGIRLTRDGWAASHDKDVFQRFGIKLAHCFGIAVVLWRRRLGGVEGCLPNGLRWRIALALRQSFGVGVWTASKVCGRAARGRLAAVTGFAQRVPGLVEPPRPAVKPWLIHCRIATGRG